MVAFDGLLLAAPVFGTMGNVIVQFTLRRTSRFALLLSIIVGLGAGCIVTVVILALALFLMPTTIIDGLALTFSVMTIYAAGGMAYFCLINLGETSLRIRMLQLLLVSPAGLTVPEILSIYDDATLAAIRLQRLTDNKQATFKEGLFYPRRSVLFAASWGLELLKRLLYGARSEKPRRLRTE